MKDELSEQKAKEILKALDEAIQAGPWKESNFLRAIGRNLHNIREELDNYLEGKKQEKSKKLSPFLKRGTSTQDQQEIFISLYSSNGRNLQSWERILANLPRQSVSRPVYAEEVDVKTIMKHKEHRENEAYVGLYIHPNDILLLDEDKIPKDKLGKPLITLKSRAIDLENITRFVHISGEYLYMHGRLIKHTFL
jgi:intracellular multiplication protein IcmQ